jgi:hypothetical protein
MGHLGPSPERFLFMLAFGEGEFPQRSQRRVQKPFSTNC